jgi:hypothetical protein
MMSAMAFPFERLLPEWSDFIHVVAIGRHPQSQRGEFLQNLTRLRPKLVTSGVYVVNVRVVDVPGLVHSAGDLIDIVRSVRQQTAHLVDARKLYVNDAPVDCLFQNKRPHVSNASLSHAPLNHSVFFRADPERQGNIAASYNGFLCLFFFHKTHLQKSKRREF